jgi:hypothetical protein
MVGVTGGDWVRVVPVVLLWGGAPEEVCRGEVGSGQVLSRRFVGVRWVQDMC